MRRVGVELAINGQTLCVLAGELDNENIWDEISETEFRSNILKDLTVEIEDSTYIYTIRDNGSLQACFLDLKTGKHLCEYIQLSELLKINNNNSIEVLQKENDSITLSILNEPLVVKEIKLISFKNKKSIIQILM